MSATFLLENITADGTTTGNGVIADGGSKTIAAWSPTNNFGGGTVAVEFSPDNEVTWIPLKRIDNTVVTFTTNDAEMVSRLGQGMKIRGELTGATNPDNVSLKIWD